jgi:periplasmic protein TonB
VDDLDDLDLATSAKFKRMSPTAAVTSVVLHAGVALAFLSELPPQQTLAAEQAAIEFTVDLSTPAPAEPQEAPAKEPPAPPVLDRPDEPEPEQLQAMAAPAAGAPPMESTPEATPEPTPEPAPEPTPGTRLEEALPPVEAPPPPLAAREFAKGAPAAAPKPPAPQPQPRAQAQSPTQPQPAALARAAQQRVPDASQRKAQEDYLWQVIRKLSLLRFSPQSREANEQGVVVARLTLARDGRLLDLALMKSSGFAGLDKGVMDAIRQASPFTPLPADIADDNYTFILPINYMRER